MRLTQRTQKTKPRILGKMPVSIGVTIHFRDQRRHLYGGPFYHITRLDRRLWDVRIVEGSYGDS